MVNFSAVAKVIVVFSLAIAATASGVDVDTSSYDKSSEVLVTTTADAIDVTWPVDATRRGRIVFALDSSKPLIASMSIDDAKPILANIDPAAVVTVGTRDLKTAGWTIFFDNPRKRPYESFAMKLSRSAARVVTENGRTSVIFDGASAGPFSGEYRFIFYPGGAIVRAAAIMSTDRDATAYTYDTGIVSAADKPLPWKNVAYKNLENGFTRRDITDPAITPQVRHRTIFAEGKEGGTVALMPAPHRFFYPLDEVDNLGSTWFGRDYRDLKNLVGFGIRQPIDGDRRWVPWVNAPPGSKQEMGVFFLLGAGDAPKTLGEVLAYTRGDTFKPLPGMQTFSSHYHVEHTLDFLNQQKLQKRDNVPVGLLEPDFVQVFKKLGVNIVHLAEFHTGQNELAIADRITRLKTLHAECARLSRDRFLLLPGEEPNVHLGGHWLSFFPKPVYWTLDRAKDQPFVDEDPKLGKVYHVGSAADVLELMKAEGGLMWTAHPRIKSSTGFPDVYRSSDFFKSDRFLGAAWKAMPADYSLPRLGTRVLDLLDDMNNWASASSERKQAPGEVDVFAIDGRSELYAHMNVNYLRLDALPLFKDGWQSVVDVLRAGRFFTTTGEVLIESMAIDGKQSGESLATPAGESTLVARLQWTFPLVYAEIISGDGKQVYRQRIELGDTKAFGTRELKANVDLRGKKWTRFEVWDVATNGAYTQPIWIE
jgi:hypothetical protein